MMKEFGHTHNVKGKHLYKPIRLMASLSLIGPPIWTLLYLIGQTQILKNITQFKNHER